MRNEADTVAQQGYGDGDDAREEVDEHDDDREEPSGRNASNTDVIAWKKMQYIASSE